MDEQRWREERGRKIQDMKEASGQKELTEAGVAAAQKEPTGGVSPGWSTRPDYTEPY